MRKSLKIKVICLIAFMVVPIAFMLFTDDARAGADDEDLGVKVNARLESNSREIQSHLIPMGQYTYWDTPELDVGDFNHESTQFDVDNVQKPIFNSTVSESFDLIKGTNYTCVGNNTINSTNTINEFNVRTNEDMVMTSQLNYNTSGYQVNDLGFSEDFSDHSYYLHGVSDKDVKASYDIIDDATAHDDYRSTNYESDTRLTVAHATQNTKHYTPRSDEYQGTWTITGESTMWDAVEDELLTTYVSTTSSNEEFVVGFDSYGNGLAYNPVYAIKVSVRHKLDGGGINTWSPFTLYVDGWTSLTDIAEASDITVTAGSGWNLYSETLYPTYNPDSIFNEDIWGIALHSPPSLTEYFVEYVVIEVWSRVDRDTYLKRSTTSDYFNDNTTGIRDDVTLSIHDVSEGETGSIDVYTTSSFDEASLTWNNKPGMYSFLAHTDTEDASEMEIDLGDELHQYYALTTSDMGKTKFDSSEGSDPPHVHAYYSKKHQEADLLYAQTDEDETLRLRSANYDTQQAYFGENLNVSCQTNADERVNVTFLENGAEKYTQELIPLGNSETGVQDLQIDINQSFAWNQLQFEMLNYEEGDWFKCFGFDYLSLPTPPRFLKHLYAVNFSYSVLGLNYSQDVNMTFDSANSDTGANQGTYIYYLSSDQLSNRDMSQALTIKEQNITLNLYNTLTDRVDEFFTSFNFSLTFNFSATSWQTPTVVDLTLNDQEVEDRTYKSGYVVFDRFYETLTFNSTSDTYLSFNSSTDFNFEFNLDIDSRTSLSKSFKLQSNHEIIIEDIQFDTDLDVRKVYLNTIDLGMGSGNVYDADDETMASRSTFTLQVILREDMYKKLDHVYNTLSGGTSEFFIQGTTNTINRFGINQYDDLSFVFPSDWDVEQANFTASNVQYKPHYETNQSNDEFGMGSDSDSWGEESVSFNRVYNESHYNNSGDAIHLTNNTYSITDNDIPEQGGDFTLINGSSTFGGDLESIDDDYTTFNAEADGHYDGTFTYKDDNQTPNGWTCDEGSSGNIEVIGSEGGHNDVCIFDDNNMGSDSISMKDTFTDQSSATIQWYWRAEDPSDYCAIMILDDGWDASDRAFGFRMYQDGLDYLDNTGHWAEATTPSADTWYRCRATWHSSGDYDFYVATEQGDYSLKGSGVDYYQSQGSLDRINIYTHGAVRGDAFYFDSFSYSWDGAPEPTEQGWDIDVESQWEFDLGLLNPSDTLDTVSLYYSHKTDESIDVDLDIWDYNAGAWSEIESVTNTASFDDDYFTLSSDHYDASNTVKIRYDSDGGFDDDDFSLYLDKLQLFHNYSINNPFNINNLTISPTLTTPNKTITVTYNVSSRFSANVSLLQLHGGVKSTLFNTTLNNNTLVTFSWTVPTAAYHELNFTVTDNFSNYIVYHLNYTIISMMSISLSYQNPMFVNENNTVTANVFSPEPISEIYYHNSTDYVKEYDSSASDYEYTFNFTVLHENATTYDISIKVINNINDTLSMNVTGLTVIKRGVFIDYVNLKGSYDQDDTTSIYVVISDVFSNRVDGLLVNYTLEAPNASKIINGSDTTNANGNITIAIPFSAAHNVGYYHLNVSTNETSQYCASWKLQSFEVLPIWRSSNASEINLKINNVAPSGNTISVSGRRSFAMSHLDNATFDLACRFKLNQSENVTYSSVLEHDFTFSLSEDITAITITDANLGDYPSGMAYYLFNGERSTDYTTSGTDFTISDAEGELYQNGDEFDFGFYKYENEIVRTQLTETPYTNVDSVEFRETLTANGTFKYWYYYNVDGLELNDLDLHHDGDTISTFNQENHKYYFSRDLNDGEQLNSTIDVNPNWDVDVYIAENTGTYTKLNIQYNADINIENVTMVIDLTNNSIYNEEWTHGTQANIHEELVIEDVDFTVATQTLVVEGSSPVPYVNKTGYFSDLNWNQIAVDEEIDFGAYLSYPKFTKTFRVDVERDWTCYNVYYGDETFAPESESTNSTIYIDGNGFDPSVNDSYLHFSTHPFENVTLDYTEPDTDGLITIRIENSLPINNTYFESRVRLDGTPDLLLLKDGGLGVSGLTDQGRRPGFLYFEIENLLAGEHEIKIKVDYKTPMETFLSMIFPISLMAALIGVYYYLKSDEEAYKKVKGFVDEKIVRKLEEMGDDEEEVENLIISTKGNKLKVETKK